MHDLTISRGSLKEVETHLELARRLGYLRQGDLTQALELCDFISHMLTRLRRSLRQARAACRMPPAAR